MQFSSKFFAMFAPWNVTPNHHPLFKFRPICAFCEVEPFGKSMEKFWIRSAGRNLLNHDNGYIRVAALQGGKGSVLLDTTSVRVFVLQCFLWILIIVKLGFSDIFKDLAGILGMLNIYGDDVYCSPVLLRATGGEGSKSRHEEVKSEQ